MQHMSSLRSTEEKTNFDRPSFNILLACSPDDLQSISIISITSLKHTVLINWLRKTKDIFFVLLHHCISCVERNFLPVTHCYNSRIHFQEDMPILLQWVMFGSITLRKLVYLCNFDVIFRRIFLW